MSDYLSNLVARTLSLDVGVRPQLPSAFEPPSMHGDFHLAEHSEMEARVKSNPPSAPLMTPPAPLEPVPSREPRDATPLMTSEPAEPPRQVPPPPRPRSIDDGPPSLESNEDKHIAPVSPLAPFDHEPSIKLRIVNRMITGQPNSMPEDSRAFSRPCSNSRPDPPGVERHLRAAPKSDTVPPVPAGVPRQPGESEVPGSMRIAAPPIHSVAPAATVLLPSPAVAPFSDTPPPAVGGNRSQSVEPGEVRSERVAKAGIRPVTPVVPAFSPNARLAVESPPPSIQVTIGRVEVRATLPSPAKSRAKSAVPPVMSLEEYLGRRASGGPR